MHKRNTFHAAFTLIEVMVAVMIVSVVIAALLQMQGNSTQKYFSIKELAKTNQFNSFLLYIDEKYDFTKSNIDMNRLVEEFEIESDLRRKLSAIKVELDYQDLQTIDTSEFDEIQDSEQTQGNGVIFEIGKTILKTDAFSSSLIRIRIQ